MAVKSQTEHILSLSRNTSMKIQGDMRHITTSKREDNIQHIDPLSSVTHYVQPALTT